MPAESIGELELEVWRYVADHSGITVADVAREFAGRRGSARTTVLTVMERLRHKRHLGRRRVDGSYQYFSLKPKAQFLQTLVGRFLDRTLGGSLDPFVAYLVENAELSDRQLRELRKLVEEAEKKRKGNRT
jgi:predicted transcriptional regulator